MNLLILSVMDSIVSLFSSIRIALVLNTLGKYMNPLILTIMGSIVSLLFFFKDCFGIRYSWERYEPPYPVSYGLNSIIAVL